MQATLQVLQSPQSQNSPSSPNPAGRRNSPSTPSPSVAAQSAAPAPIVWEVPAGDALKKVGKADTVDSFLGDFLSNQLGKNVASLSQGSSLSNLMGKTGPSSVEPQSLAPSMSAEPVASRPRATEPVTASAPAARLEEPVSTTEPKAESVSAPATHLLFQSKLKRRKRLRHQQHLPAIKQDDAAMPPMPQKNQRRHRPNYLSNPYCLVK